MQLTRVVLTAVTFAAMTYSQDQTGINQAPTNTKPFTTLAGNVMIEAYSHIGSVSDVSVSVGEDRVAGVPNAPIAKTIRLTLRDGAGLSAVVSTERIGLDEIDSSIKGIEYLAKVDKSNTNFDGITAAYSTKRGVRFEVWYFSSKNIMLASVWIGRSKISLSFSELEKLRQLLETAKAYVMNHSACLDQCK
jgi:hypothetical protein